MVLDASVLVALHLDQGQDGEWAASMVLGQTLVAPHLLSVEVTSAIRRLARSGFISSQEAEVAQRAASDTPIDFFPFLPFRDRVWELRENVTPFDAWYVAIAEVLQAPLVTLDNRLAKATGPTCQFETPPLP